MASRLQTQANVCCRVRVGIWTRNMHPEECERPGAAETCRALIKRARLTAGAARKLPTPLTWAGWTSSGPEKRPNKSFDHFYGYYKSTGQWRIEPKPNRLGGDESGGF
ncbi:hypothetical protein HRR83_000695 [Exophiala dermatitidis]|uniref:Uncharacterized protein n=1 Tax=Exophiala dermatitidis TaxID=5970 RepID=A0AAN6J319_EXODE|nr:hypothetical protein HRR74_000698 [Exophiala dermatitidis]KAJ4528577.1 hypothetical protein HRR73_001200 [Exophiala dermatitidis]KAJ4529949.1 hypothetical protein HRR76_009196 [Exophiala dermatitidis]KAJ4558711.1 hypothetical protein HRR77_000696 [Exophiala dermatitidis]KAJ4581260.1 hypothetical protein HRR79_000303 [Exophiala dermatitidis]